jgi:hypothetical protein
VRIPILILSFAFCALLVKGGAYAAPATLVEKQAAGKETAVEIAPHRAIYDMSLTSLKNGSNVTGVSGKMIFEWADSCDGWAIQQNLQLQFSYAQGDTSKVASNEVTWESKDGKRYNFNIRRVQDGKETENYRGKAGLGGKDSKAVYANPEGKIVTLTGDTVFPSAHTKLVIAKAKAGEHFFMRRVFDGTDEGGSNDVSVYISPPQAERMEVGIDGKPASDPLLTATAWPVHMAFFKLDDETGQPDYEMDLLLLANGVARSMKIDYGDFSVTGTLKAIEPLPVPHC